MIRDGRLIQHKPCPGGESVIKGSIAPASDLDMALPVELISYLLSISFKLSAVLPWSIILLENIVTCPELGGEEEGKGEGRERGGGVRLFHLMLDTPLLIKFSM